MGVTETSAERSYSDTQQLKGLGQTDIQIHEVEHWGQAVNFGNYRVNIVLIVQENHDLTWLFDNIAFEQLVREWHEEIQATSSMSEIISSLPYLRIIAMGKMALPFIMERIEAEQEDPDHWFAALNAITGYDPVPEIDRGDSVEMAKAWLSWGADNALG